MTSSGERGNNSASRSRVVLEGFEHARHVVGVRELVARGEVGERDSTQAMAARA